MGPHHQDRDRNRQLQRTWFALRATGVNADAPRPLLSGIHTRGYLPHVKREGASYFVTFRLADSLPKTLLLEFESDRAQRLCRFHALREARGQFGPAIQVDDTVEAIERDYRKKVERFLDTGGGECWLRRPELADRVAAALQFFGGDRYRLDAWVVMPNHVHVVVWPAPNHTLSRILQSWKRFTAREANRVLGRVGGPFWQPESFDHWIRTDAERARCCAYIHRNPVKAGLCGAPEDWRWSSAWRGA